DLAPGLAELVDQRGDTIETGRRLERELGAVRFSEHAEDSAQLVERVVTRRLDRRQRAARATGLAIGEVGGDPGLHVDRGQRVRDHVMHLPRNPQPLLLGAPLCLLLTRSLGELEPLEQQLYVRAAVA